MEVGDHFFMTLGCPQDFCPKWDGVPFFWTLGCPQDFCPKWGGGPFWNLRVSSGFWSKWGGGPLFRTLGCPQDSCPSFYSIYIYIQRLLPAQARHLWLESRAKQLVTDKLNVLTHGELGPRAGRDFPPRANISRPRVNPIQHATRWAWLSAKGRRPSCSKLKLWGPPWTVSALAKKRRVPKEKHFYWVESELPKHDALPIWWHEVAKSFSKF